MTIIFIAAIFIIGFLLGSTFKSWGKKTILPKTKRRGEVISLQSFLSFDGSEPKAK